MDAMLAAKRVARETATGKAAAESVAVASAAPKKMAIAPEEGVGDPVASAAPRKSVATDKAPEDPNSTSAEKTSESSAGEETEDAPVVSAAPTASRGSRPAVCPICAAKPAHVRSRCGVVRGAMKTNRKMLNQLKAEQAESPTPFREAQIKLIEEVIREKEAKGPQKKVRTTHFT